MDKARRNPFRGFMDTISEMNRMREHWFTGYEAVKEDQQRTHATAWVPTTDIFARGRDLIIRTELAGVRSGDVDITLSGGVLAISGERTSGLDEEELTYYTRERSFGHFRRTMTLPEGIDGSKISASFEDGLLEIIIEGGADLPEPHRVQIDNRSG